MSISLPRLDLTQIFCDVGDFYAAFEVACQQLGPRPYDGEAKPYRSRLSLSEVTTFDELTGISFIDSTSVVVCYPNRAKQNRVFKHQADWGKSSVTWYFGYPAGRLRLQTTLDYQR